MDSTAREDSVLMVAVKFLANILLAVVVTLAIIILPRLIIGTFEVQQISMLPTLEPGERITVNRLNYSWGQPERGDIIVFYPPQQPVPGLLSQVIPWFGSDAPPLIKRVIGLPGDTLEVFNGKVWINGKGLDEPYIKEKPTYQVPRTQIPEDQYFVLGDNRNNSRDSHYSWTVPRENIVGKALFTFWPFERLGSVQHNNNTNTKLAPQGKTTNTSSLPSRPPQND